MASLQVWLSLLHSKLFYLAAILLNDMKLNLHSSAFAIAFAFLTLPNILSAQTPRVAAPQSNNADQKVLEALVEYYNAINIGTQKLRRTEENGMLVLAYFPATSVYVDPNDIYEVSIPLKKSDYHTHDLNGDKIADYIVEIDMVNGNEEYSEFATLLSTPTRYIVTGSFSATKLCDCGQYVGFFTPEQYDNNRIIGTSSCYKEKDSNCCPSISKRSAVQYLDGKLVPTVMPKITDIMLPMQDRTQHWDTTLMANRMDYLVMSDQKFTGEYLPIDTINGQIIKSRTPSFELSLTNQFLGKAEKFDNAFWAKTIAQHKLGFGIFGKPHVTYVEQTFQKIHFTLKHSIPNADGGHIIYFTIYFDGTFELEKVEPIVRR
jgi:hypothetical protein